MKQWHRSHNKQNELNVEKKLYIAFHYIANAGCYSLKMIRRKAKDFSWRFFQFEENGATRDVQIFLWPSLATKKKLLYGNARNVNKSRNMPSRKFLWSYHSLTRKSAHCKQKAVLLRATHIWKIILANFETKIKKLSLSSGSSQENVRGVVHFSKSCSCCCLQVFRKEFHCNRLSEFSPFILNKANEISCLCLRDVLRKISIMVFISGTVTDAAAHNFLKKKSSTIVSWKKFSKSFETK